MDRSFHQMPGHSYARGFVPPEDRYPNLWEMFWSWLAPGNDPLLAATLILCGGCALAVTVTRHVAHVRTKSRRARIAAILQASHTAEAQAARTASLPQAVHRRARSQGLAQGLTRDRAPDRAPDRAA